MAKKVVKKKVASKKSVKKVVSKKSDLLGAARAWRGFIFFLVLFLISYALYLAVNSPAPIFNFLDSAVYANVFYSLSVVFGLISGALLIAVLVYFFYAKIKIRK